MEKMVDLIPKLKDRSKKHRTDMMDLSSIKLAPMAPAGMKKPKAIKIKKR